MIRARHQRCYSGPTEGGVVQLLNPQIDRHRWQVAFPDLASSACAQWAGAGGGALQLSAHTGTFRKVYISAVDDLVLKAA